MRIVAALGGNALLQRGEKLSAANQRRNVRKAAEQLMPIIEAGHDLVITHGSGPQIGLLALKESSYKPDDMFPLDMLDAEVEGMIGYVIEQELMNATTLHRQFATLLTQIEVDPEDPAFSRATKPIGAMMNEKNAKRLANQYGWTIVEDAGQYRRAVASPKPVKVIEADVIKMLVEGGVTVICGGGGGIPVVRKRDGKLEGCEAVIDKDHATAMIADDLDADMLLLLTDVDGVYKDWGKKSSKKITSAKPGELNPEKFPEGSMRPKIEACSRFSEKAGRRAVIGSISQITEILTGNAGTLFELPQIN